MKTTHGHYQIEMQCSACHTPMMGVKQDACTQCHAQDLKDGQDSHPENKFSDPRNFDMIAKLDACKCITCHTEHSLIQLVTWASLYLMIIALPPL